jgi:hypothetical protein
VHAHTLVAVADGRVEPDDAGRILLVAVVIVISLTRAAGPRPVRGKVTVKSDGTTLGGHVSRGLPAAFRDRSADPTDQEEWENSPEGYPQTPPYNWWSYHDAYPA